IDPLFLTPRARYHEIDGDRAQAVEWPTVQVKLDRSQTSLVHVRAAYFPPTFARIDKGKEATGLNANARFTIMKANSGLIVSRLGRQIDVVTAGLWTQFQNNDRYWALELDFPP